MGGAASLPHTALPAKPGCPDVRSGQLRSVQQCPRAHAPVA